MQTHRIIVSSSGDLKYIYSDELRPLHSLGEVEIKRASSVEPQPDGTWGFDMTPMGRPDVKVAGFTKRADALSAEVKWIEENELI